MEKAATKPYVMREVPGKGKGLIATSKIPKGTRILSEAPLFQVSSVEIRPDVLEALIVSELHHLTKDQKRAYVSLRNSYSKESGVRPIFGIAKTNVLLFGTHEPEGGLFLEMSCMNHSCRPNTHYNWNNKTERLTIHALRDIQDGEELTVSYMTQTGPRVHRQKFLEDCFFFHCECELCGLSPGASEESDMRLLEIAAIEHELEDGNGTFYYAKALALLREIFAVFREEGIWDQSIPKVHVVAFQIACMYADERRAKIFAQRALDVRVVIEGEDSLEVAKLRGYVENPSQHASWQLRGRSPPDEVARMEGSEVDDWLWGKMTLEAALNG
ncbi:uncharacterized protein PODANS_5_450 [Podospora anserina S mat+]|uniref:Podospora anserina S mat+ genomic DNA chromosome 5, supercontig 1 n=1 Tax=Podospora anserina (strain S / ATCC MYA-4624 / DSM 980 / FGSC 10383) TaxID=515849 RepID=B2AF60_PODAN|nr:uncharacterized protein PODANS_5_450 [Podospora anserina S mat+]CAP62077.1 unnamed protein product [Podospora anserina S mat+]CDP29152.1 Putative protein of unknown function [Podospora anserina S mat+]